MASFQNADETLVLFVPAKNETVRVAISGTYDQVIDLQRELGSRGSGAWVTVKTFNTENATEAFDYTTVGFDENVRLLLRTDDGGDATVTLTETTDLTEHVIRDSVGNALATFNQDTATFAGLTSLAGNIMATEGGVGIVGTAETYVTSVSKIGGIIKTTIMIDLTGLTSTATDDDIIGLAASGAAYIGQITAANNGTIWKGKMYCMELPTGGQPDVALWSATEATGIEGTLITALTQTELLQSQGDGTAWAADDEIEIATMPAADQYLYLVSDGAITTGVYTAGRLMIEFWGV